MNVTPDAQSELLTAPEVAARLRLAVNTVYLWAKNGKLDPVRIGTTIRFRSADIDALLRKEAS